MLDIDSTSYRSPNQSSRIEAIVLHTTEGSFQGDLDWLVNSRGQAAVSCHYYVSRAGGIYQLVDDERAAWHAGASSYAGRANWNRFSLGVELEHKRGQDWPSVQRTRSAVLCRMLMRKHGIPRGMIVAHRWIATPRGRKSDPTDWPDTELQRWIAEL